MKMLEPHNLHELKSLQGRLTYIRRFISNLANRCQPFNRLMKKDVAFMWDKACNNSFKSIKAYLLRPPVLKAPIARRTLILYIAVQKRLGAFLAQKNDEGKEASLYYLSRTLNGAELNYSSIEKICLALMFAVKKLRHYLQAHSIRLISQVDPLKYLMSKSVLSEDWKNRLFCFKSLISPTCPKRSLKDKHSLIFLQIIQFQMIESSLKIFLTKMFFLLRFPCHGHYSLIELLVEMELEQVLSLLLWKEKCCPLHSL